MTVVYVWCVLLGDRPGGRSEGVTGGGRRRTLPGDASPTGDGRHKLGRHCKHQRTFGPNAAGDSHVLQKLISLQNHSNRFSKRSWVKESLQTMKNHQNMFYNISIDIVIIT